MSIKAILLVAASALIATPDLAMAKSKHHGSRASSSDAIVNHSGGPISYAELTQISQTGGYNSRASRHRRSAASAPSTSASSVAPAPSADAASPPATAQAAPDTSAPAPAAAAAPPPADPAAPATPAAPPPQQQ